MASLNYNNNGVWQLIKQLYYKNAGTWVPIKQLWYKDNTATWREIFVATNAPSVVVSNTPATTRITTTSGGTASQSFTASVSGGTAPYTYSWAPVTDTFSSGSGTTTATLTLSYVYTQGKTLNSTDSWQLTVTDAHNLTVQATVTWNLILTAGSMSASISPTTLTGSGNSGGGGGTASTSPCVCTVSGGSPPYSYAWTFSSNAGSLGLSSPTASSTFCQKTYTKEQSGSYSAVIYCKVTDSASNTATSNTSNVTITIIA